MSRSIVVAVTGHRPLRACGGYGQRAAERLDRFAVDSIAELHEWCAITHGIVGMALGWDQACARAFSHLGIPWTAALPCLEQERAWPEQAQKEYRRLLRLAERVHQVTGALYSPSAMLVRNQWMVDRLNNQGDTLLALWDGIRHGSGGTAHCVAYAESVRKPIINMWSKWKETNNKEGK